MSPVKILIITPALNASSVIGITKPLIELEKRGLVTLKLRYGSIPIGWKHDCDWCDIAVFNRAQGFDDLKLLYYLKRNHKKIIYDIDDNFLEIPISIKVGQIHRFFTKIYGTAQFYKLADITKIYTTRMRDQVLRYNGNPSLINNYFDRSILGDITQEAHPDKIRIAFATARLDDPKLGQMTNDILCQISDEYGDQIEIHLWRKPEGELKRKNNIILHKPTHRYEDFVRSFYMLGFDIGLAPLMDHPFYHSKSNNKYREYGGMGIASIYSNVPPYSDCITHGVNGYLAENNADAWITGLRHLIDNASSRKTISTNALQDVIHHYSFENFMANWHSQIQDLMKDSSKSAFNLPFLESKMPFPLTILLGQKFEQVGKTFGSNVIISLLIESAGNLGVRSSTRFLNDFFSNTHTIKSKRFYAIPTSQAELEMLQPLNNQSARLVIDVRLLDTLSKPSLDLLHSMNLFNPNLTLFVSNEQSDLVNVAHKNIIPSITELSLLDRFQEDYVGLQYYKFLESFCFDSLHTRTSAYKEQFNSMIEVYDHRIQTIKRRILQVWELIQWRMGNRTQ